MSTPSAPAASEEVEDTLSLERARAIAATLECPVPQPGEPLPPLWHWAYCLSPVPQSALGPDGHPQPGGIMPRLALSRRMWAGSRLSRVGPLRVGERVRRCSRVMNVSHKQGRSGPLAFVALEHRYETADGLALVEEQDVVYRDQTLTAPAAQADHRIAHAQRSVDIDERLLFRYSALTFNAHRIHYDLAYATQVEGYPGLVVHGPLIASLLLSLWRELAPEATWQRMRIRAMAPVFAPVALSLCAGEPAAGGQSLWARRGDGTVAQQIELEFA